MRQAHSELQRWCSLLGLGDLIGQPVLAASVADADMARSACLAAMHSARDTGTSGMESSVIRSLQSGVYVLHSCNPMLLSKDRSGCLCLQGMHWPVDRGIKRSLLRSRTHMQGRAPGWLPWPWKLRLHYQPCRRIPQSSSLSSWLFRFLLEKIAVPPARPHSVL